MSGERTDPRDPRLQALAELPDDVRCSILIGTGESTVGELRRVFTIEGGAERVLTTGEASDMFGYSQSMWGKWAEAGKVEGAYRDEGEAGYWRLPLEACREHLERLKAGAYPRKRRKRGPWKTTKTTEATTPQAERAGTEDLPAGQVVELRPPAMGRGQADDEEPEGPELAEAG